MSETPNEIVTDAPGGVVTPSEPAALHEMLEKIQLSTGGHIFFVVFGVVLLIMILLAVRHELKFLSTTKPTTVIKSLSFISFAHMFALSFVIIFHFYFNLPVLAGVVIIIAVILLIITPIQVAMRMRAFQELKHQRIEEKTKLMRDVSHIIDTGKKNAPDSDPGKAPSSGAEGDDSQDSSGKDEPGQ